MEKKIVMVTGATSGIGEACAKKFANGGYNVIITGRRHDKLEALKTQLEAQGARVLALTFDVREREAARKRSGKHRRRMGRHRRAGQQRWPRTGPRQGIRGRFQRLGHNDRHQCQGIAQHDTVHRAGNGETKPWPCHQHRIGGGRRCLCQRQRLLCHEAPQ